MNKVFQVPAMSYQMIWAKADDFINLTYPSLLCKPAPFPLTEFIDGKLKEVTGFDLHVEDNFPAETLGQTDFNQKEIILASTTYELLHQEDGRARFTVGHEIGHVYIHAPFVFDCIFENRRTVKLNRSEIETFKDPDWQAEVFASAILMPTNHISRLIRSGVDADFVARTFKVSRAAAKKRIEKYLRFRKK